MAETIDIEEPGFAKWLFASTAAAWIWLVVRLYIGYEFLHAGWDKLTGTEAAHWYTWHSAFTDASWLRDHGAALKGFVGFVTSPAMVHGPNAANNFGWYQNYLHFIGDHGAFFAYAVTFGEILVGLGLIFGCLTGVAAFFGVVLNVSFGMAGIAGVNPEMAVLGMLLILAWRNAGYIGLDRYVLPALGTPWHKGKVFEHPVAATPA